MLVGPEGAQSIEITIEPARRYTQALFALSETGAGL